MFHKTLDKGTAGDQMGILVKGLKKDELRRGMVVAKKNTVKQADHFDAKVTKLNLPVLNCTSESFICISTNYHWHILYCYLDVCGDER